MTPDSKAGWRAVYVALFSAQTKPVLDAIADEIERKCGRDTTSEEVEAALRHLDEENDRTGKSYAPKAGRIIRAIWTTRKAGAGSGGYDAGVHRDRCRAFVERGLSMYEILRGAPEASRMYGERDRRADQVAWYLREIEREQDLLRRWDMVCAGDYVLPWMEEKAGCRLLQELCHAEGIEVEEYGPAHPVYIERVAAINRAISEKVQAESEGA